MKRKILILTLALTLASSTGITAFAAPVAVDGGGVFDAEYYADNNPDVESVYGRDFDMLWWHYTNYGAGEGRLPFAPDTDLTDMLSASENTDTYAIEGVKYPLSMVKDQTLEVVSDTITFNKAYGKAEEHLQAPDGYKWVVAEWNMTDRSYEEDAAIWYWSINAQGSTDWTSVSGEELEALGFIKETVYSDNDPSKWQVMYWHYYWVFNLTYNDNTYLCAAGLYVNEDCDGGTAYMMVPEGYAGSTISIAGSKVENGTEVKNYDNNYTFLFNY